MQYNNMKQLNHEHSSFNRHRKMWLQYA